MQIGHTSLPAHELPDSHSSSSQTQTTANPKSTTIDGSRTSG